MLSATPAHSTSPASRLLELTQEGRPHVQESTPDIAKTAHQVRSSAEEDAEAEGPGQAAQEEVGHEQRHFRHQAGQVALRIWCTWLYRSLLLNRLPTQLHLRDV